MHPRTTFILFRSFFNAGLCGAALTGNRFLLTKGLSLADVSAINLFFWGMISLMELPTGLLADGKSRALSLQIGAGLMVFALLGYATVQGFWTAVIWECVLATAIAFVSGAEQAWITDALIKRGEQNRVGETFATASAFSAFGIIVAGTLGGLAGLWHLRLGWVVAAMFAAVACRVAVTKMGHEGDATHKMTERQAFAASLHVTRTTPQLVWAMGLNILLGLMLPFNQYWTPYLAERIGAEGVALLWAPFYLALGGAGLAVRRGKLLLGNEARGIVIALCIIGLALAGAGLAQSNAMLIAFCIIHQFGRGLNMPLMDAFVQRRIDSGYRATYGSFQSLVARGGYVVVLGVIWWATQGMPSNAHTIKLVWTVCGFTMVAVALLAWRYRPKTVVK